MQNKNSQPIIYSIILIVGIFLGKFYILEDPSAQNSKLDAILTLVEENYVDGFDISDHEDEILISIMQELDPHSSYIPVKEQGVLEEEMRGSFSGVGIEFNIIQDSLVVVSPISGGPSEKLGILSGDRIVEVDGEDFASVGLTNQDVIDKLRGEKDSKVQIKIYRRGLPELLNYTIVRGDIPLHSVDASVMLSDKIGYVKVNRFSGTTNKEFYTATNKLLDDGMSKLILDLRGNPGGFLGSAIYMCNEFLEKGELIVYTEGKYRKQQEIYSDDDGRLKHIKLVVLINQGSASASEIVSGCIQDLDRGIIIGNRSFGKGLVQEEIKLPDGSAVRLTTQRYYIPSGRSIQKSYGKSDKEYHAEMYIRSDQKEENIADSLKYTTKSGRVVYGGGGITPDSIITVDSSLNYTKYNIIRANNWISEFALTKQKSVDFPNRLERLEADKLYQEFERFIHKKNEDFDLSLGEKELLDLKIYLKATLIKNLYGNDAYFRVITQSDKYVEKAIEVLE